MLIFTPSCRLFRAMKIEQLLQFSDNSNSVQSTVTNNKFFLANRYPFGSHDAQPKNNTIPILKYSGKFDNNLLWLK